MYRIAVFGYQPSRFTLVARFNSSEPLPLTLGQPQVCVTNIIRVSLRFNSAILMPCSSARMDVQQSDQVLSGTLRQYAFDITSEVLRMPDGTPADLQVRVNE